MITLSDGRQVEMDLTKCSMREFRALFLPEQPQAEEDEIVARCAGLTADEYLDLPQPDARRILIEFLRASREPLADPNSASGSSSA